jgi:hypothetical protein
MLKLSDVLAHLYPDSLRRVLLVRAPAPFPALWTIISPLMDEKTRAKVWLYSGSETDKNLQKYLLPAAIPTWLGKKINKNYLSSRNILGQSSNCNMTLFRIRSISEQ